MKNYQQTVKQRRVTMAKNKAALAHSRKPGRTYAEAWGPRLRINNEPIDRLKSFDHTRFTYWY